MPKKKNEEWQEWKEREGAAVLRRGPLPRPSRKGRGRFFDSGASAPVDRGQAASLPSAAHDTTGLRKRTRILRRPMLFATPAANRPAPSTWHGHVLDLTRASMKQMPKANWVFDRSAAMRPIP